MQVRRLCILYPVFITYVHVFTSSQISEHVCAERGDEPFFLLPFFHPCEGVCGKITTISKKPHQKTTFVVFLTGEENHNVVFWMEQKNHIVVIRPHDRRVQSTTFVHI